ncbi:early nodulin-like protein 19 [Lycium barbarum]|uniref:early nodulin-like protein 19 n=1 Tax=Lycium barbarum TaxID=112863 RepID=UPI00293E95B7|nr:early nodulin-like protein 19 [Lycium barbarum]
MALWVLFLVVAAVATIVSATDHIVGGNKGWNPDINYTLWSNNQTFYVGDFISFRYQKTQHNVLQVNKMGYDSCTIEGALGNWSSGKDFIKLDKSKRYYFICGIGGCSNGMKLSILVHPLSQSPPPRSAVSAVHSSEKSAANGVGGFGSILVLVGLMAFVCAWI